LADNEHKSPKDYAEARGNLEILDLFNSRLEASSLDEWADANPDMPGVHCWTWKFADGWNKRLELTKPVEPEIILLLSDGKDRDDRDPHEEVRKVPVRPCVV
jgi:hypothetical protein